MMSKGFTPMTFWKNDVSRLSSTQQRPNSVLVHLVLLSVQVCFSGWHVLAKVALNDGVNPVALAMARETCATILMFIIARRVDGVVKLDPAHAIRFFWMGVASCGNVVGAVLALRHFNPMAFGVMQPSIPVFAMILSHMGGVETMSRLTCVGVLISVTGAVWVEYFASTPAWAADASITTAEQAVAAAATGGEGGGEDDGSGLGSAAWVGSLILFTQCVSMASLMVLQKPMLAVYPSATVTAWYYAVGSALTTVVCVCYGVRPSDFLLTGKWEPWIALVYAVIVGTVYTYNAYAWVLNVVSPTTATTYLTLQPVTTAILSVIFLHATVRGDEVCGGAVIAIGLLVTIYAKTLERRGSFKTLRAKQDRELSRVFKTPRRHRFRRAVGMGGNGGGGSAANGDLSNSDTDGLGMSFDSDQDPLLGGVGGPSNSRRGSYDPQEAARSDGSLRRFLALV